MAAINPHQERISISDEHWAAMHRYVAQEDPLEACGLVAGRHLHSLAVFPVTNELHSPTGYRFAPQEQVALFMQFEEKGWDLLAIYHSHPAGGATPSETDIQTAAYPDSLHLIWSKSKHTWTCRAFRIGNENISEVPIEIFPTAISP
jgi:proteasome lid subunit RPN8/RPN11